MVLSVCLFWLLPLFCITEIITWTSFLMFYRMYWTQTRANECERIYKNTKLKFRIMYFIHVSKDRQANPVLRQFNPIHFPHTISFKFYFDMPMSFHLHGVLPSKVLHPGFLLKFLIHFWSLTCELWLDRWLLLVFSLDYSFFRFHGNCVTSKMYSSWSLILSKTFLCTSSTSYLRGQGSIPE